MRNEFELKGPIQSVEVSYFVHATEDAGTISKAVSAFLPDNVRPVEERVEGHFGNPIVWVRYHLTDDDAGTVIDRLAESLSSPTKDRLEGNINELIDEHSALYLRFDKQFLVMGRLEVGTGDPVRIRVKPRKFLLRAGAKEFYREVLLGGR